MKRTIAISIAATLALVIAGGVYFRASAGGTGLRHALEQPYPAPEIGGIEHWINTGGEDLTMEKLRGKVVLVDFWTYSCINCLRTLPYITRWYDKYKDDDFVLLGVHSPEFDFEYKADKVEQAVKKHGIAYPVALDNKKVTWNNFRNRYWPAHYLIDREGRVVYTHFGEGEYDVTEHNIRTLLGMKGPAKLEAGKSVVSRAQTHETYLGTLRAEREVTGEGADLPLHHWRLSGGWTRTGEYVESGAAGDALTLHFAGRKVFLVMTTADDAPVEVEIKASLPGNAAADVKGGRVTVHESRLYEIVNLPGFSGGTVTITPLGAGVRAFAFTFES